ncbi:helix-turn-helix domain-containing protein [Acetobacter sp. TBRC 12305]|uniref:Helix-turn-helix domain-containing protein n=1 Tax=Acetobacter garciniae TaxID=2817435 RepID=A0A939HQA8_9PROT|nr:IclR family transcriptional regulator C-terminal domain-containing protein [Acetobacter garciniae]MBO1326118.1 helix-turn-helix domain-containing protein [Acetobacter garciniae]MBX0345138.1 helix-turn-helix domain-containing protein [Acetobacter garciniae]
MSTSRPVTDRDYVDALARGLDILMACANEPAGLTLAEAARRTGTTRASARRSLLTLVAKGYLITDGRLFRLTPKVLALAAPLASAPIVRTTQPVLDDLSRRFDESFSLATLVESDIVYLVRSEARRIVSLNLGAGSRLPAWCTSMGRVLLASLPVAERQAHVPAVLNPRTPRTLTDRVSLMAVLDRVGADGYCILDEELELGLRSLAVPVVRPDGTVAAALNIGTQSQRTSIETLTGTLLPALREAAALLAPAFAGRDLAG